MGATLSNLAITSLNIGKKVVGATLPTLMLITKFGKEYGPYTPFLDTKLYYGELLTMLFLSEVHSVTEGYLALSYALDALKKRKPSLIYSWNVKEPLMFGLVQTLGLISRLTTLIS
jgi:hypothetical protein